MKKILALIDLTVLSEKVMDQATAIAKAHGASLVLGHVLTGLRDEGDAREALAPHIKMAEGHGIPTSLVIEKGELFDTAASMVKNELPDLVVAATHGLESIQKHAFGSSIHKLVKALPANTLVVSAHTSTVIGGYKKILIPVAPHLNFKRKIDASLELLALGGTVTLFAITKVGYEIDPGTRANIEATKAQLETSGVKWTYSEAPGDAYAVGYATQTLRMVKEEGMDLVAVMADVSQRNMHFGKIDKTSLLLNTQGVQVLCANAPM